MAPLRKPRPVGDTGHNFSSQVDRITLRAHSVKATGELRINYSRLFCNLDSPFKRRVIDGSQRISCVPVHPSVLAGVKKLVLLTLKLVTLVGLSDHISE